MLAVLARCAQTLHALPPYAHMLIALYSLGAFVYLVLCHWDGTTLPERPWLVRSLWLGMGLIFTIYYCLVLVADFVLVPRVEHFSRSVGRFVFAAGASGPFMLGLAVRDFALAAKARLATRD